MYSVRTKFVVPKPTDDKQREIGTMFNASSEKNIHDGVPEVCGEEISRLESKVKKKAHTKLTLPPLYQEPLPSAGVISRPLLGHHPILRNIPSEQPSPVVELPHFTAQVGPGRAIAGTKWTEGPCLMASALRTHIPFKTADESVALR